MKLIPSIPIFQTLFDHLTWISDMGLLTDPFTQESISQDWVRQFDQCIEHPFEKVNSNVYSQYRY
jgi:hypothetical protein